MRGAKKGDQIMYYHTGTERQAVGLMIITSDPYPNPKESNERFIVVDVKFEKLFKKPVTLDEMKLQKSFKNWELLRIMRLSFMPVPEDIWKTILKLSNK
jgi:predicted RNA-binding protein with PUA-like domain